MSETLGEKLISTETADQIYTLFVATDLATEHWRRNFVENVAEGCREYRLDGCLGSGGKFYASSQQWRVGCYREDDTPEREEKIRLVNLLLEWMHDKATLQSTLAAREAEIERLKLDDPQFDATDYAHPAWWRGHDNATAVICQKVHEALDGKDDGQGGNHDPWGAVRQRLVETASQLAAATKRIGELESERDELLSLFVSDEDGGPPDTKGNRIKELEGEVSALKAEQQSLESERAEAVRGERKAKRKLRFNRWYGP